MYSHKSNSTHHPVSQLNSGTGPKTPVQAFRFLSSTDGTNLELSAAPSELTLAGLSARCLPILCAERAPQLSLPLHPGPQSLLQLFSSDIGFLHLAAGSLVSLPISMTFISCHTAAKNSIGCNPGLHLLYDLAF